MEYSYTKKTLLRYLSEDARTSTTTLSKNAHCSRNTVVSNIKMLEKDFKIQYLIDFNKDKLGLSQKHILKIKFGSKPLINDIKNIVLNDNMIKFAAITKGDFDLILYAEGDSGYNYMKWETALIASKLSCYSPVVRPSQLAMTHIGFMPLTNEMLKDVNFSELGLDNTDRDIILILNTNSRISYSDIARILGITEDKVRYRFKRIKSSGIIDRFTIALTIPPTSYNLAIFVNYRFTSGTDKRAKKARANYINIDGNMPLINKFQFLAPISGSYRFFMLGCFDDKKDAYTNGILKHKEAFREDKPSISHAKIEQVIKGYIPVRNIDIAKDYKVVEWTDNTE